MRQILYLKTEFIVSTRDRIVVYNTIVLAELLFSAMSRPELAGFLCPSMHCDVNIPPFHNQTNCYLLLLLHITISAARLLN